MFYYFLAYRQLGKKIKNWFFLSPAEILEIYVPEYWQGKWGLPIDHFIASNNSNDTVTNICKRRSTSQSQVSILYPMQWMLVIPAILCVFFNCLIISIDVLKRTFSSYSFNDDETTRLQ